MFVSMSRTIGYSIMPLVSANRGAGPMSIIWCTIGVSGMLAPAIRAICGLQAPQAITTRSASMSPLLVRTRLTRPRSTSMPRTSVLALIVAPASAARSRISVAARRESTTPAPGVWKPPTISCSLMNGTSSLTSSGVSIETGSMPQEQAEAIRRVSSCIRGSPRAISIPPDSMKTPRSLYWRMLSSVSEVISLEWSTGKMKFEAWPVEPPGFGSGPLSSSVISVSPSRVR